MADRNVHVRMGVVWRRDQRIRDDRLFPSSRDLAARKIQHADAVDVSRLLCAMAASERSGRYSYCLPCCYSLDDPVMNFRSNTELNFCS